MNRFGEEEFLYSFMIDSRGKCSLIQGDEVMWTSAGDRKFRKEFPETVIDESDLPAVQKYLEAEGYVPPGVEIEYDPDAEENDWLDDDSEDDE